MADVFVVAIFIVYLATKASVGTSQAVAFVSHFEPGFYLFATYCIVALIGQQFARGAMNVEDPRPDNEFRLVWMITLGVATAFCVTAALPHLEFVQRGGIVHSTEILDRVVLFQIPSGLTYGIFVLAPLALRLRYGAIRSIILVFFSHATYYFMVLWAVCSGSENSLWSGSLQGSVGAAVILFGCSGILDCRFSWRAFFGTLIVSGFAGVMIVNFGWEALVKPEASELKETMLFYGGHLLWQVAVATALVLGIVQPSSEWSSTEEQADRVATWRNRLSVVVPGLVIVGFVSIAWGHAFLHNASTLLGRPTSYTSDFGYYSPVKDASVEGKYSVISKAKHLVFKADQSDGFFTAPIQKTLDWDSDLSISITCTWLSGETYQGHGFYWAYRDKENLNYFVISAAGQYRIGNVVEGHENGEWEPVGQNFNKESSNRIEIRRKGEQFEFFVNGNSIGKRPAGNYSGSKFGLINGGNQEIVFDDLRIVGFQVDSD